MRFHDFYYIRRSDRRIIFFLLAVFIIVSLALLVFHGKEGRMLARAKPTRHGRAGEPTARATIMSTGAERAIIITPCVDAR